MKKYIGLLLVSTFLAACNYGEPQSGTITLALPRNASFQPMQEGTGFVDAPGVTRWRITVTAEDIQDPIVVDSSEEVVRIPVKPGPGRIVRVAGRGETVDNITQGFDGEVVVDVPEDEETEAVVDVFRSVTVTDTNLPVGRAGVESASAPDIAEVTLTLQAESVLLIMSFNNDVYAPWDAAQENSIRGMIELDLDRNIRTGDASKTQARHRSARAITGSTVVDEAIGVDATVELSPQEIGYVKLLTGDTSVPVSARFAGRTLSVTIPYANVGGKITGVRFVAFATDKLGSVDFAPEKNYVQLLLADVAAPVATLKAVTKFSGNFIAAYREGGFAPLPVLRASPVGLHAAWLSPTGVDYAFSETGKVFQNRQSFRLETSAYDFMNFDFQETSGIDLSANAKGQPTIVVSQTLSQYYTYPYATSTAVAVVQANDGGYLPVLNMALEPGSGYGAAAQVVSAGDAAIIAGITDVYSHDTKLLTVRGGVVADSASVTPYGDEHSLTMDGLGNFFYSYSGNIAQAPVVSVNQLALSGNKPELTPIKSLGEGLSYFGLRSAAGGKGSLHTLFVISGGVAPDYFASITVFDPAGTALVVPDANVSTQISDSGHSSLPAIAVSKSGRVGVVWHTGQQPIMMGAPGAPRLSAPISDFTDTIFYSEKLPGENVFSTPVIVGAGSYASIAFDALEKPVVLVSNVKVLFDPNMYSYTIESAELTAYQGE